MFNMNLPEPIYTSFSDVGNEVSCPRSKQMVLRLVSLCMRLKRLEQTSFADHNESPWNRHRSQRCHSLQAVAPKSVACSLVYPRDRIANLKQGSWILMNGYHDLRTFKFDICTGLPGGERISRINTVASFCRSLRPSEFYKSECRMHRKPKIDTFTKRLCV